MSFLFWLMWSIYLNIYLIELKSKKCLYSIKSKKILKIKSKDQEYFKNWIINLLINKFDRILGKPNLNECIYHWTEIHRINKINRILNKSNFNECINKYDNMLLNSPLNLKIQFASLTTRGMLATVAIVTVACLLHSIKGPRHLLH